MWRYELIAGGTRNLCIAFFGVLLFSSCTGPKSIVNVEILEPAGITYPENVQRIGYLNHAPLSRDSYNGFSEEFDPVSLRIIDTMVCKNLQKGFLDGIKNTELSYLDSILFLEFRRKDTTARTQPLTNRILETVFNTKNLDALIILDYYAVDISRSYSHYSLMTASFVEEYKLIMEVAYRTVVKNNDEPLDKYVSKDTLYFMNESSMPSSTYLHASDVIRSGAYEFGYAYGMRHIPVWNQVSRVVFRGREEELRQAAAHTDMGNWDAALQIWTALLSSEDQHLAAKAAHNIAVYYELEDDVETALGYASKAVELWVNHYTELYKQELKIRYMNREDLLKQVR
ncbi:MAG: DUF6340 family protein [Bacteroidales bacterium]|nr:DUF6340 family protein [Bacteroidales bacterium]